MASNRIEVDAFKAGAQFIIDALEIKFNIVDVMQVVDEEAKDRYPDYDPETDHVEKNPGGSHRPLRIPKRG